MSETLKIDDIGTIAQIRIKVIEKFPHVSTLSILFYNEQKYLNTPAWSAKLTIILKNGSELQFYSGKTYPDPGQASNLVLLTAIEFLEKDQTDETQ